MTITRYTSENKQEWDEFVRRSKNGTFLFERGYMDYHSDRFEDHSLMFRNDKQRLVAVLPANIVDGKVLKSHGGLTYGSLIIDESASAIDVKDVFDVLIVYMKECGIGELIYKQMPSIYHLCPAEEDEYWLWRNGAQLMACLLSVTVPLRDKIIPQVERRRKRGMKRAQEAGCTIERNASLEEFWPIMEANLQSCYNAKPAHTVQEMKLLQSRFPENIKCYIVRDAEDKAVAGAVLYDCSARVVHVQYGHATPEGKEQGALDMLYLALIDEYRSNTAVEYFDFGTSNEQQGRYLNENLIAQKEGFGGRGIAYKQFVVRVI